MAVEDGGEQSLFDLAVAVIVAREFLEAAVIVGSYKNIILRTSDTLEEQRLRLKIVNQSTFIAAVSALFVVACVAIPLGLLSRKIDTRVVAIIEGVSKLIAAIFIAQLSLKVPVWLDIYKKSEENFNMGSSIKEMRFNIIWNIWREVAECGVFLLPYFFSGSAIAIPVSFLVGLAIGVAMGLIIYYANRRLKKKFWLCFSMAFIFGLFSVGLFVSGCSKMETVFGSTPVIWQLQDPFWNAYKFPMTLLKPFGYSSTRTVLQCAAFWSWTLLMLLLHYRKYKKYQTSATPCHDEEANDKSADKVLVNTESYSSAEKDDVNLDLSDHSSL